MASEAAIQNVSDTAFLVAHHRAVESARPDALFRDPFAASLAGAKGKAIAQAFPTAAMTGWMVAIRTFVIDEFIRGAILGGVDTIVNIGAGLDTRPYWLELPPRTKWVEIDYPHVIAFKERLLGIEAPRCRLERVGLDLADVAARRALLGRLDAEARSMLVLTEGVVPYLDLEQAASLADDLGGLAHVRSWIVDYVSPASHAYRQRSGVAARMREAPLEFQPPDWFGFFESHGWRPREIRYLAEEGERLGRRAPLPWRYRLLMALTRPFTPPDKRDGFRKFSAYVLLEREPITESSS